MANRIYITPVASLSLTPPQIGIDEEHPISGERQLFYQWIANNIAGLYALNSGVTATANAEGFTLTGGAIPNSLLLIGSNAQITGQADGGDIRAGDTSRTLTWTGGPFTLTAPAAGVNLTLSSNFTTTGAFITSLTQSANTVQALPGVSSNLVGATGGVLSVVAPAAGATMTLAGDLETQGAFKTTVVAGAATTQTLPVASSNLVGATGGVLSAVAPAAGATLTVADDVEFSGAFKPTFASSADATFTLPGASCTLASTANITGKKKTIRLPVTAFTKADGTVLAKYAADDAGTVGIYGDGTTVLGLRWNNTAGATDTVATSFGVPADCDVTVAPTIKLRCAKVGATAADIPAITVGMYAQTDGALYDAGANLGVSLDALANPATKTVQLASKAMSVFPGLTSSCTLTINPPAAQMTTDDLIVSSVEIEYTCAVG